MAIELTNEILQRFSPMDSMKRQNLSALAKKTSIRELESGLTLFSAGDTQKRTLFLVEGKLELTDTKGNVTVIESGTAASRHALAPVLPRLQTAIAKGDVQYISIDTDLLDVMLTWDQTGSYEVSELADAGDSDQSEQDWMTTLLQTRAFQRIPPANIQAIFMRMQQINYRGGDTVIRQGEDGDFFYAITRGTCSVVRETPLNKEGIRLAELSVGDTFGEEALISESKRNATVTFQTDGSVMRLAKDDFNTLLNQPMLDWLDYAAAKSLVAAGAKWLDVRLPSEFASFHEPDAINIPLYFIRLKLSALDRDCTYVLCCDTGRRSSAAAFILNERGFDTRVLQGGLNNSDLKLE
ncbi:MAG: cyclic nucleotide-binding domain-containing protein [Gammaproteobacteria bacterium]|jgi:CRP-like cAMP-binding protein|nr:cyclic nucleotide-binding domain-containing protein [Gammaproteobacteria bacterium]